MSDMIQKMAQSNVPNVLNEPKTTVKIIKEKNVASNISNSSNRIIESNNIDNSFNEIDDEMMKPSKGKKKFKGPKNVRQRAVVAAFQHAWKGYKNFAWGHDMLKPISKTYHDWFSLGLTLVDALDTMIIMNLEDFYTEARDWVHKNLIFSNKKDVNLFEVTIRVLGGLLSAYHLSNDVMFLQKAADLGTRLLPCFDTNSGVPYSDVNLATLQAHSPRWSPDSSTSEVTTIQLEFRDLSRSTGNPKFEESAAKVSSHVHELEKTEGLVPIFINANTGDFRLYSTITLGARGDSYYEYLLKQWIQTGRTIDYLKEDYLEAINGVQKLLVRRTFKKKLLFIGELLSGGKDFKPKMDHLTCYLPGTLALGVMYGMPKNHMDLAEELLYTCYQTYAYHPTFLAPEISYFNVQDNSQPDIHVKTTDAHNLLRPEFVESLWIMYQITGNTTYQDWGWQVFEAFEKFTKVANGYTSIGNVKSVAKTRPKDIMESFFLGETLKYLYLLFGDDRHELSLKEFVLNSEAHPLPIYTS
ncbi:Endoplasmic reticulum mannosyl-oligosaccharide 1,2-alpha-mannosidase, putative [Pediculus humanus corporis]|uniref:alpha-1,2-Mannosidase n=1 Tax=Pediculus humanus subsp. corporis TaxID=121224 RepID=E0VZD5_PEDHC|nr:Endoplasmic reticulum mannosyl-oligosaccharide 1,2-alpha-mannosidase, putative [Pediculus humanus corporis]EEB18741.1 Endoplasmic reticulum mannosyl-oligosaccharide 1,2-alpha-mannosidase, putative [Pediculus humanus corporis]